MINTIWKDIPDYEGIYKISNTGIVKRYNTNKIIKQDISYNGYSRSPLSKETKTKKFLTHRLVMFTFKPEEHFEGAEVNHRNGIKTDNRLENLEWCTHAENKKHAFITGLTFMKKGEDSPTSKINQKIANIIKLAHKQNYFKQKELADIFGLSKTTVNFIIHNKRWNN
jgi:ribosome-binding protein aMBF1 (putative translation factor)